MHQESNTVENLNLREMERNHLTYVFSKHPDCTIETIAALLGITDRSLYMKMKQYNLKKPKGYKQVVLTGKLYPCQFVVRTLTKTIFRIQK